VTSLPAVIGALGPPLGPHLESDLAANLYSVSTLIVIIDKSDRRVDFIHLKKFVTLLPAAIGALGSPLGPHLESNLATDLYSGSTSIAIMDEFYRWVNFNCLNKSAISLLVIIGASGSPLGPRPDRDLAADLYSGSTLIAIKDESNCQIRFR
jgi:hypothetical protein